MVNNSVLEVTYCQHNCDVMTKLLLLGPSCMHCSAMENHPLLALGKGVLLHHWQHKIAL